MSETGRQRDGEGVRGERGMDRVRVSDSKRKRQRHRGRG